MCVINQEMFQKTIIVWMKLILSDDRENKITFFLKKDAYNTTVYMERWCLLTYLIKHLFNLIDWIEGCKQRGVFRKHWKGWHENEAKWILIKIYLLINVGRVKNCFVFPERLSLWNILMIFWKIVFHFDSVE